MRRLAIGWTLPTRLTCTDETERNPRNYDRFAHNPEVADRAHRAHDRSTSKRFVASCRARSLPKTCHDIVTRRVRHSWTAVTTRNSHWRSGAVAEIRSNTPGHHHTDCKSIDTAYEGAVRTKGPHGSNNSVASVGAHQNWAPSVSTGHTEVRTSPGASNVLRPELSRSCHNSSRYSPGCIGTL